MKRTLQVLLVALMFVSTVSGAVTKKAKAEATKKLVPAASTDADQQQPDSKKTPVAQGLPHIPMIPMVQVVGENDKYDPDLPQHLQIALAVVLARFDVGVLAELVPADEPEHVR